MSFLMFLCYDSHINTPTNKLQCLVEPGGYILAARVVHRDEFIHKVADRKLRHGGGHVEDGGDVEAREKGVVTGVDLVTDVQVGEELTGR